MFCWVSKKGCLDPNDRKYNAYPPFEGSCQMNYQSDIQSMVSKYSHYFYSSLYCLSELTKIPFSLVCINLISCCPPKAKIEVIKTWQTHNICQIPCLVPMVVFFINYNNLPFGLTDSTQLLCNVCWQGNRPVRTPVSSILLLFLSCISTKH